MKHAALIVLALAISVSATLSGCGKSKRQLEAEAATKQEAQALLERKKTETEEKLIEAAAAKKQMERTTAETEEKHFAEEQNKANESLLARLQTQTAQQLKDPSSAQFRNTRLNDIKTAACGEINAKNSYGGYEGFRKFVATQTESVVEPNCVGSTDVLACSKVSVSYAKAATSNGCN